MKRKLLLIYTSIITCAVWAAPRSQEQAAAIARNFFSNGKNAPVATRTASDIHMVATSADLLQTPVTRSGDTGPAFYVYNRGQEAFVIVSGDDRMKPILGYSEDGAFVTENLPENIREWLGYYAQEYRRAERSTATTPVSRTTTRTNFAASVAPLLQDIQYDQDTPYNNQCPLYSGKRSVTGCVATAIAQIMRYWKYPSVGTGSHSYTTQSLNLKCTFNFATHPFDWDNMLPTYTGTDETEEEINAISTLMLACGVACDMDYTPDMSGATPNAMYQGLIKYLNYDSGMYLTSRDYYTADEWMNLIKTELNEKRPIYYGGSSTGGGHAFVVDGYDTRDLVHVNWGWGGYCNGYFEVQTLNADGSGIGGYADNSYQFYQSMIVGLQPKTGTSEYVSRIQIGYLELPDATVTAGVSFSATAYDVYNMVQTLNGAVGLIAEKDGKQTVLSQKSCNIDYLYGWSELELDATVPTSLTDGTYELYIASKATGEAQWNKAYGDPMECCTYTMVKQGNRCTLYGNGFDFDHITGSLEVGHTLYTGYEAGFTVTIKNSSDTQAFFGELGVGIVDANGELVEFLQCKQATIEAGEETQCYVSNAITAEAGTYYAYTTVATSAYYYYIDNGQAITVKTPASGTPTLSVTGGQLEQNTIESGSTLGIHANLSIVGNGDVNTTWLRHTYLREGESDVLEEVWDRPFVEKGSTTAYSYNFRINAEPGQYVYKLYTMHPVTGLLRSQYQATFTVTEASGIQDAVAGGNRPYVCSAPGENNLLIHSDATLEEVTICNLSGQIISKMRPEATGNGEYLVPAHNPGKGCHVMILRDKNNNRYTLKFIR